MVTMLIDEWIYARINDQEGIYGRQEMQRNRSRFNGVKAAFLDYETKTVISKDQRASYQEALINAAFNESYMVAHERVSASCVQIFAAPKKVIEDLYAQLNGSSVESVVPYGAAVRAFLNSKERLPSEQCVIFLDDLKNQALLTIFDGACFTATRRIHMRDEGYMFSEVKRTWQSYLAQKAEQGDFTEASFKLLCNNPDWLRVFVSQGFLPKEQTDYVQGGFIVLEGLKSAKFAVHFAPAKEILKQRRRSLWKSRLKSMAISIVLVFAGLGAFAAAHSYETRELAYRRQLQDRDRVLTKQSVLMNREKFLSLLDEQIQVSYSRLYYDFIRSLPAGYLVDGMDFQMTPGRILFEGVIYPQNDLTLQDQFKYRASFSGADMVPVIINKSLGQKIVLSVDREDYAL